MRWSFYIESNEVFPLNQRELKIKKYLENEYIRAYRKSLSGDIVLMGSDYAYLKTLESGYKDEKFTFEIKESDVLHFSGEFTIYDCTFDDYKKTVSVKITQRDEYTAIQENEDIKVNIISASHTLVAASIYSYLYFYVIESASNADTDYAKVLDSEVVDTELITYLPGGGQDYTINKYAVLRVEERVIVDPDTTLSGWTLLTSDDDYKVYARKPEDYSWVLNTDMFWPKNVDGDSEKADQTPSNTDDYYHLDFKFEYNAVYRYLTEIFPDQFSETIVHKLLNFSDLWFLKSIGNYNKFNIGSTISYKSYLLKDSLNLIADYSEYKVISSILFNDDPEPGITLSDFYSDTEIKDKYLITLSDFKKPNASEKALKAEITWKQITEYLCVKFNLRWFIDSEGYIRFEHVSYFNNTNITDISNLKLNTKYSYLQNEKPNREYISESQSYNEDFAQVEVLYGTVPALEGVKENTKTKNLSIIHTDIDGLNSKLNEINDDGFLLVEVENSLVCKGTGFKSGSADIQNVNLSNANVLNAFHRHEAYQDTYYIGGTEVTAQSLKRMKKHEIEFMGIPDTDRDLVTAIGRGQIEYIEYALTEEERVKAEVHYE